MCFCEYTANNWRDFWEKAFVRGSNTLMLDKAIPIGNAQPPANAGMERLPVITAVAINPVLTVFEIPAKSCFVFSYFFSVSNLV